MDFNNHHWNFSHIVPTISNLINDSNSNNQIDEYNKAVSGLTDDEKSNMEENASKYNSTGNSNYYNALNLGEVISYMKYQKSMCICHIQRYKRENTISSNRTP